MNDTRTRELFSRLLRWGGFAIIAGMIALLVYGVATRPQPQTPLTQAQIDLTVDAAVAAALPTANVTQTIVARLTATALGTPPPPTQTPIPSVTPIPTPAPVSAVEEAVNTGANFLTEIINVLFGILGWVWNVAVWLWEVLSFGGIIIQGCCCIGLPLLIVVGALNS